MKQFWDRVQLQDTPRALWTAGWPSELKSTLPCKQTGGQGPARKEEVLGGLGTSYGGRCQGKEAQGLETLLSASWTK